jgi:hypothetical protein
LQLPPLQLSLVSASQVPQAPPPVPQLALLGALHVVPVQQPVEHEVASHTHAPPTQRWPTPHAAPAPHWQPPAAQLSARVVSQVAQPPPAVPHAVVDGVWQTLPLQQPLGQLAALHTHAPPTHACPAPQGAPVPHAHAPAVQRSDVVASHAPHAPPAGPHAVALVVATHVLPWQQPAHVEAQPAQLPPTQLSPAAQA